MSPAIPTDEFANDPAEVHAIMHGFFRGFFRFDPRKIPIDIEDVRGETHYYKFGYIIGWVGSILFAVGLYRVLS